MARSVGLSRIRTLRGLALALLGPPVIVVVLAQLRGALNIATDTLVCLLLTVIVSLVGGIAPAVVAAVLSMLLLNYFFIYPEHTLRIADPNDAVLMAVFLLVAVLVSATVHLAAAHQSKMLEAQSRAATLAETDRLRTALLAAVGHDLRTPLATVKATVSALRSAELKLASDEYDELLAGADVTLDRLAALVSNLLDMSRLQVGALALSLQSTDLADVGRSAVEVSGHSDSIEVSIAEGTPAVLADAGLVERILANLVENAVQHGKSESKVRIHALEVGETVEINVVDFGAGVRREQHASMFRPFQQLGDNASTGLGLGLALSRGLADAMGGSLAPRETFGGGLTMTLTLPVAHDIAPEPGRRERDLV